MLLYVVAQIRKHVIQWCTNYATAVAILSKKSLVKILIIERGISLEVHIGGSGGEGRGRFVSDEMLPFVKKINLH